MILKERTPFACKRIKHPTVVSPKAGFQSFGRPPYRVRGWGPCRPDMASRAGSLVKDGSQTVGDGIVHLDEGILSVSKVLLLRRCKARQRIAEIDGVSWNRSENDQRNSTSMYSSEH